MREHIHKVYHKHIQVVNHKVVEVVKQLFAGLGVIELVVGETVVLAVAVENGAYEWRLVEVLSLIFVFINPQVGEHLGDVYWHQSRENRIAGILRSRGQDAAIQVVVVDGEVFAQQWLHHAPLVEAEVVDYYKEHLLAGVEQRKHLLLEYLVAHERVNVGSHPFLIVFLHKLGKFAVSLYLLHS